MDKLVALCRRRGFLFQSSEIYGGLNGFWDYGPLGVELKRNIKNAWWQDMVTGHNELVKAAGAPSTYEMVGLDASIIMHPQVWKCSGHFDLFADKMQTCRQCKRLFRADHVEEMHKESAWLPELQEVWKESVPTNTGRLKMWAQQKGKKIAPGLALVRDTDAVINAINKVIAEKKQGAFVNLDAWFNFVFDANGQVFLADACPECGGDLTEPRDFNLMFETIVGALKDENNKAFLRPETAQGIFVNFKNVCDSTRVKVPFGIAQVGKSFRNEITPRNFTFRSREFEQMEIEFFCHPTTSRKWYEYWRDRRMKWYTDLGLAGERLRLREHDKDELSHYSVGTADIEYAFPFLTAGEYGELEGIAHRGDFDLRSHMEGKLVKNAEGCLEVELVENADGKKVPKHKGSGRDLTYRDDVTNERFTPHVIEPSAGADRGTLAFLCEAYHEDQAPDEKGDMQTRTVMKFHPRIAPVKAAVFPLVKKDGMPEAAKEIYTALKRRFVTFYDEKGAVGRRYRRQDEAGTPFCITVDGQTLQDGTVTIRDRDSLEQWRVKSADVVEEVAKRVET
ncbi:MAG: glycine--tRNA ligase [Pirellulales bacterium]